jgi:pimeloyl-ACP methyl ester carboxylesterase
MHIMRPYLVGESLSALGRAVARLRLRSPDGLERMAAASLPEADAARFREDGLVRDGLVKFLYSHLEAPPGLAGLRNDLTQIRRARKHPRDALSITAPTLVLHGTADDVVPLDEAEFHARAIPGASIEIYEGAGHVFMLTHRSEVTRRIGEFLASTR